MKLLSKLLTNNLFFLQKKSYKLKICSFYFLNLERSCIDDIIEPNEYRGHHPQHDMKDVIPIGDGHSAMVPTFYHGHAVMNFAKVLPDFT